MAEDMLVQKVVDGKIDKVATKTTNEQKETRGTSNLGKDAFLQLLVAEMQNQDPLEPSTNTEWISQLATFSQLEELQSISKTSENSQIFSLVGKQVIVTGESPTGAKFTKSGVVDYITYNGGEAKFSVDGNLYTMTNLSSIIGDDYFYEKNKPAVVKAGEKYTFDGDKPQDIEFEVNMGADVAKADNVALMIGNTVIPSDYVTVNGNKVSVKADLLQELAAGVYTFDVVFDDKNYTTVKDAIEITVFNPHPTVTEETKTDAGTTKTDAGTSKTDASDTTENKADENKTSANDDGTRRVTADNGDEDSKMKAGDLSGFDYDAVRALYPELTDEEFEQQYGYLFEETGN